MRLPRPVGTATLAALACLAVPAAHGQDAPEGPAVGEIEVAIAGEPTTFEIIGGMRAGTGWGRGQFGPFVNLMGYAEDGSGARMKIRFMLDEQGTLVCSPMDTLIEYYPDDSVYRLPPGPECGALAIEDVDYRGPDEPLAVSGSFEGSFGGLGGNERAFEAADGRFRATVEPF